MSTSPIEITSASDPRIKVFTSLTDSILRSKLDPKQGIMIVESPKVITTAIDAGCQPIAILCEEKHIDGDAKGIINRCNGIPVYTGSRNLLSSITGYTLTRGVLCAMKRPMPMSPENVVDNARRIAVLDGVCDATNLGAIFRSAAALGLDAILLTPTACDPLCRRSIRVSMGSVFLIPWAFIDNVHPTLRNLGFKSAAMALTDDALSLSDKILKDQDRLAIILGTEGEGLDKTVINDSDFTVIIPMHHAVDSLNVGAAAAIAFWELSKSV